MKVLKKKFMSLVLVASIAIIGFLFTPTEKAEASEVCINNPGYAIVTLCAENDGLNVNTDIWVQPWVKYFYTMELQRYQDGRWNVIGTRTGKLESAELDYHVYKNVRRNNGNDKLKVYVKLFRDQKHLDYVGAVQSPFFYR
jgi:hypothetical protein